MRLTKIDCGWDRCKYFSPSGCKRKRVELDFVYVNNNPDDDRLVCKQFMFKPKNKCKSCGRENISVVEKRKVE